MSFCNNYFQNEWKQKLLSPFPHLQKYKHKMPKIIIWIANDVDMQLAMRWFCEDIDTHFTEYETTYPMIYDDVIECVIIRENTKWKNYLIIHQTLYCHPQICDKFVFRKKSHKIYDKIGLKLRDNENNRLCDEYVENLTHIIASCICHQSIYTNHYTKCIFLMTICETHNDKNHMQNYGDWLNAGKILADDYIIKTICKF